MSLTRLVTYPPFHTLDAIMVKQGRAISCNVISRAGVSPSRKDFETAATYALQDNRYKDGKIIFSKDDGPLTVIEGDDLSVMRRKDVIARLVKHYGF